ncbi:cobalt-precorrin-6A reductase [Shimia abyssi]|uniref:Precorrin-6A reductase n=1 Tax=Shimia abyssi TaxID=1662395 RepID=A0A2P8FD75_9RHOB|nr:cobalt-precorrin-6A reductase [Shimia abyssi]PSL19686.1 precorrin-6A reductase [Shimia abyssi]
MDPNLLILGGTTEASALAKVAADHGLRAVFSYAGRVSSPRIQPIPQRVGGFGGVAGLVDYLNAQNVTHVVDATHPFAAQMSWNAHHACVQAGVPLLALTRPAWQTQRGDDWHHVADIEGAVAALNGAARRVMLALGKLNVPAFAAQPQHHYVLRLVDTPAAPIDLPNHNVVVARGPFDVAGDMALFREHSVDVVLCKNAGGVGAEAKLHAARALGLPVIMIDRPTLPPRTEVASVEGVLDWLAHVKTERGV